MSLAVRYCISSENLRLGALRARYERITCAIQQPLDGAPISAEGRHLSLSGASRQQGRSGVGAWAGGWGNGLAEQATMPSKQKIVIRTVSSLPYQGDVRSVEPWGYDPR